MRPTEADKKVLIKQGRLVELPKADINAQDKQEFYAQLLFHSKQKRLQRRLGKLDI